MNTIMQAVDNAFANIGISQDREEFVAFVKFLEGIEIKNILEIGTYKGGSLSVFSQIASGKKISIDLTANMDYDVPARNAMLRKLDSNIHLINADSHLESTRNIVRTILNGELLDVLFIDGDHSYSGVRQDLFMYSRYVKPDGYIVFHDIKDSEFHRNQGCYVNRLWKELQGDKREIVNANIDWGGIGIFKKQSILVLTAFTTNIIWKDYGKNDYIHISKRLNEEYAILHGYDFECIEYPEQLKGFWPTWIKIESIVDELEEERYKYICWIDADAIFTSKESLDFMMGKDIAITKALPFDNRTLTTTSTGLILIKVSTITQKIFQQLLWFAKDWKGGEYKQQNWHEQGLLDDMYVEPEVTMTYAFSKAYFNLINHLPEDLEEAFETEHFKILPHRYQTDDSDKAIFVFHAAGNTYTKASRLKQFETPKNTVMENDIIITYSRGPRVEIKGEVKGKYKIDFIDTEFNTLEHSDVIDNNMWTRHYREWFTNWKIVITDLATNTVIKEELFDPTGKTVYIRFESRALGDTIAWIPYVDVFGKKNQCKVICATFWNQLFDEAYPDVTFIPIEQAPPSDVYAIYDIGWFGDTNKNPVDVRLIPLQKTATDILGLPFVEIVPKLNYDKMEEKK